MPTTRLMKAIVKSRPEPGLWLEDVPVPEIGINDVLVRVKKAAICGTDIHILNWDAWAAKIIPAPMVIGHEFMGEIAAVGSNVVDFFPGQLVSGEGHVSCRTQTSVRAHQRRGREPAGCVRGIYRAAHDECVGP
jgi:threonine 3-dehydrogenase